MSSYQEGLPLTNEPDLLKKNKSKKLASKGKSPVPQLTIQHVFGISAKSHPCLKLNPSTGELAYAAGSVIVIYNIQLNKQTKYICSPNRRVINCLNFSRNGKFLVFGETVCRTSEIFVYDLVADQIVNQLRGHRFGISHVLYSPNSRYLISIGDENDGGLFVWDVAKNYSKLTQNKLSKKILATVFNPSGNVLITAGVSHLKFWSFDSLGNIIMVKVKDKEDSFIIEGKNALLGAKFQDKIFVDLSALGHSIYTLTQDALFCVINENRNLEKWMDLKVIQAFSMQITEKTLICACSDGLIRVFKSNTLEHVTTLPKPPALGNYNIEKGVKKLLTQPGEKYADTIAVCYDEARAVLVTLYSDGTVFIWDMRVLEKVAVKRSFLNHKGTIHDIQLLSNSTHEVSFFATGSLDKTIRIWHLSDDDNLPEAFGALRKNVYCKHLSRILYLDNNYDHLKIKTSIEDKCSPENQIRCIRCSFDSNYLAIGDQQGNLRVFSLITFAQVHHKIAHDDEILCLDFTPDNPMGLQFLASGSRDRLIHLYDVNKDFELVTTLDEHSSSISALKFAYTASLKRLTMVSCGADRCLIFREYRPGDPRVFVQNHLEIDKKNKFFSMELNQDHSQVIIGQEKRIQIWNMETGKLKETIETKEEERTTGKTVYFDNIRLCIDSSGTYIATSHEDRTVRIKELATGFEVARVNTGDITTGMIFTQNNKNLITVSSEGCIFVYKLTSDIKTNIERKKIQLGLIVKKMKEYLGISKDLTLDSFWIERDLRDYMKNLREKEQKENPIKLPANNNNSLSLQGHEKHVTFQPKSRPITKEIFLEPKETVLEFSNDLASFAESNLISKEKLPFWALTKPNTENEEDKKTETEVENEEKRDIEQIKETPGDIEKELVMKTIPEKMKSEDVSFEEIQINKEENNENFSLFKNEILLNDNIQNPFVNPSNFFNEDLPSTSELLKKAEGVDDNIGPSENSIKDNPKETELWANGLSPEDVFINNNYINLDEEIAYPPRRKNEKRQSISTKFLMGKSEMQASKEALIAMDPGQIVMTSLDQPDRKDVGLNDVSSINNKILRFRKFPHSEMESILDLNQIQSQISEVNKNLENIKKIPFLDDPSFFSRDSPLGKRYSPESKAGSGEKSNASALGLGTEKSQIVRINKELLIKRETGDNLKAGAEEQINTPFVNKFQNEINPISSIRPAGKEMINLLNDHSLSKILNDNNEKLAEVTLNFSSDEESSSRINRNQDYAKEKQNEKVLEREIVFDSIDKFDMKKKPQDENLTPVEEKKESIERVWPPLVMGRVPLLADHEEVKCAEHSNKKDFSDEDNTNFCTESSIHNYELFPNQGKYELYEDAGPDYAFNMKKNISPSTQQSGQVELRSQERNPVSSVEKQSAQINVNKFETKAFLDKQESLLNIDKYDKMLRDSFNKIDEELEVINSILLELNKERDPQLKERISNKFKFKMKNTFSAMNNIAEQNDLDLVNIKQQSKIIENLSNQFMEFIRNGSINKIRNRFNFSNRKKLWIPVELRNLL